LFTRIGRQGGPGPFEFVVLLFLTFGGLTTLTHLGAPTSLNRVLSDPLLLIWSVLLSLGSAIGFVGVVWWGRETTALIIEQVGLISVAGAAFVYAVVLISQLAVISGATVLTSFIGGFGTAAVWRIVQITQRQRAILDLSRKLEEEHDRGEE
jgi:hypothetical protein